MCLAAEAVPKAPAMTFDNRAAGAIDGAGPAASPVQSLPIRFLQAFGRMQLSALPPILCRLKTGERSMRRGFAAEFFFFCQGQCFAQEAQPWMAALREQRNPFFTNPLPMAGGRMTKA